MQSDLPLDDADRPAADSSGDSAVSHRGFSLATLLLMVTLVSIVCGLAVLAPGLGILAAILAGPALARTALIVRHHASGNLVDNLSARLSLFASSLFFTAIFGVAAGACCYGSCWPGALFGAAIGQLWERGQYAGLTTGVVMGFGTGGIVACIVLYVAMTRIGLPFPSQHIQRGETLTIAGVIVLAVIGGFLLCFYLEPF